jgi:type IV secretion system protein VirB10
MSDESKIQSISSTTPVAATSKWKRLQSLLLLIGVSILVIAHFLFQHISKIKKEPPEEMPQQVTNMTAPTVPKANPPIQQFQQIKEMAIRYPERATTRSEDEEEAEKLNKMRMIAPTTVYASTNSVGKTQKQTNHLNRGEEASVLGGKRTGDANMQFMNEISKSTVPIANATHIAHPATTLAQGTMISATLESRIVSDLPGMIRAVTAEDIYSEEGPLILLPKGSRLIGQYTNAISQGQQRIFVVWQRLIRPDHIDIQLNSPGTDALGAAGMSADHIDHHFFEKFGTAVLLSIISASASNMGVNSQDQFNSAAAYREAIANSFSQTAQNTLRATGMISPTIYIDQGKVISVFVARDLDFYNELSSQRQKQ